MEVEFNLDPATLGAMTTVSNAPDITFEIIAIPSPVSSIEARDTDRGLVILVGTEDGTIRRYTSPSYKVTKALRGLSKGVSWVQFSTLRNEEDCFWVSSGMEVRNLSHGKSLQPYTTLAPQIQSEFRDIPPSAHNQCHRHTRKDTYPTQRRRRRIE